LCLCLPASGLAQAPSPAARAIAKGQEAVAFFEQGKYDEALAKFQQAEALYHSPVFLLYAGRSLRETGRWVEASVALRRVASETLDDAAPLSWKQAQADARRELAALAAEVPSIVVIVEGGTLATQATIDGTSVAIGEPIEVDPGEHRIVASDGDRTEAKSVTVSPRVSGLKVVVTLPPAATPETSKALPEATSRAAHRSTIYVPGLVVAGAGAATVVAGGVVGVFALTKSSAARGQLPASCDGTTCSSSRKEEIEANLATPRRLGTVADVLFVTGGVAVAVGVYLMIVHRAPASGGSARVSSRGASFEWRF
jgi:hypothetical protein